MGEAPYHYYPKLPDIKEEEINESDTSGTEEDSKSQDAEDAVSDVDLPQPHMTSLNRNCQNVYVDSYNAHGVKVENSGNIAPRVSCVFSLFLYLAISSDPNPSDINPPSSASSSASSASNFPVHKQ